MIYGIKAAGLLGIVCLWLFLMYKEFFMEKILNKSPIVYAISHQLIIIPLIFYVFTVLEENLIFLPEFIGYALVVLSSFFTYEVGRKMDPNADKILGTYLVHYGKVKTHALITILASLAVVGSIMMGTFWYSFIPFILILITQVRVYKNEKIFDQLEGIIALTLIYNMWFMTIRGWFL